MPRIPTRPAFGPSTTRPARGFTMIELLVTLSVLALIALALSAVLMTANRGKTSTVNYIESAQAARSALEMIAIDLRSAGYGADLDATPTPQPPIAYVDSVELILAENLQPTSNPLLGPVAYNPLGSPRPHPLEGSPWTPATKYRTGAELIRYTLDATNDGVVNGGDMTASVTAKRTKNPDDYVLMRQVYGDSTNNVPNFNGPQNDQIALVSKPGGANPPLFTVYLRGFNTPWNWAGGAIPVAELKNIDRVVVNVTATSAKPDTRGQYAQTVFTTEVNTSRNVPNWGVPTYAVTGFVYNDANLNHVMDGELGIPGVTVRLGPSYTAYTNAAGGYVIKAPAGTYTLRHVPLPTHGAFDVPDSVVLTVPPATAHSFADTLRHGGSAYVLVYHDMNGNLIRDAGESGKASVRVRLDPAGTIGYTDAYGYLSLFVQTGGYTLTCTPPDSFMVASPNPIVGNMTDGGFANHEFALMENGKGTIKGKVFRDNNRDGALQAEPGIKSVWVGVTTDGGVTIQGYAYTDDNGDYSIDVPVNDPPRTSPYSIYIIVPSGYFPTSRTAITGVLNNNNFGVVNYQIITLNASRVLSLGSANLMEKDWTGSNTNHQHGDADIVLGADAGGTDNISVWFNQYDSSPLFSPDPTAPPLGTYGYTRNAANSVLSLAVDTLDANVSPFNRPDIATGTQYAAAGNLFVWFNQNSSGNYGILPAAATRAYRTQDNGDVQSVLAYDCAGGNSMDLIAGTKSPTAGTGTIEIWRSDNGVTPDYGRLEVYPPSGSIPGNKLGEVTAMRLADLDNDGLSDLVVGTKTGATTGQVLFFHNEGKSSLFSRFTYRSSHDLDSWAVTSLACLDVNGDGYTDVVAGTRTGPNTGQLLYFRNEYSTPFTFVVDRKVGAPGIVTALIAGDFGGDPSHMDIAMGWRDSDTGYGGGVEVFFCDIGTLPSSGTDPSGGAVFNFVPALTDNNFNYGIYPSTPAPPFLTDLAAGIKASPTTGAIVVFIR